MSLFHHTGYKMRDIVTGPQTDTINAIDLSSTSKHIAVGTASGAVQVWDVKAKTKTLAIAANGEVNSVRFNAGARHVVFGTSTGRVSIVSLANGQMTCSLASSQWAVRRVEFSPHQRYPPAAVCVHYMRSVGERAYVWSVDVFARACACVHV